jgi:hypothetical protein
MQQKQRFAAAGADQVEIGAIGGDREMLHGSSSRRLERFRAKRTPVRVRKTGQNKNLEHRSDSPERKRLQGRG